ncbi:hypothetical protein NHQ30_005360 [Ciborinia camelliae]|nr:hypothetical protein NHQ30_005360 [Ciborinia camelliae]
MNKQGFSTMICKICGFQIRADIWRLAVLHARCHGAQHPLQLQLPTPEDEDSVEGKFGRVNEWLRSSGRLFSQNASWECAEPVGPSVGIVAPCSSPVDRSTGLGMPYCDAVHIRWWAYSLLLRKGMISYPERTNTLNEAGETKEETAHRNSVQIRAMLPSTEMRIGTNMEIDNVPNKAGETQEEKRQPTGGMEIPAPAANQMPQGEVREPKRPQIGPIKKDIDYNGIPLVSPCTQLTSPFETSPEMPTPCSHAPEAATGLPSTLKTITNGAETPRGSGYDTTRET